jgi:anti-sigma regulatory factor (Ser/Thr protein kinase)
MTDFAAELPARQDAIAALTQRVAALLADSGVDARAAYHVELVLDELLTNVAAHGGSEAPVHVSLTISPERVAAEVVDGGVAFDPCVARNVDVTASMGERAVGGLGLLLVQRMTESLAYERTGDRNQTRFSIRRTPAQPKGQGDEHGVC